MNENITTPENLENHEMVALQEAHIRIVEKIKEEVIKRHSKKLYHAPSHTEGVVSAMNMATKVFGHSFSESLQKRPSFANKFTAIQSGMEAGMLVHDVVIEIDGVNDQGMLQRRRGWQPGGNEYESYMYFMENFDLDENNPYYEEYVRSVKQTIAGTDPDAMDFASPVEEKYLADMSPEALACITNGDGEPRVMRIDSKKAGYSIEALLGSSSDLAASAVPDIFFKTGNLEFWELQYQASKDCAAFLKEPTTINREKAIELITKMKGWRRTQVGVAVGQKIRFDDNYTPEKITELFENKFNETPSESEVSNYISTMHNLSKGVDTSIEMSTEKYKEFSDQFSIDASGDEQLSQSEQEILKEAIEYMGGEEKMLQDYVDHVDEELKK